MTNYLILLPPSEGKKSGGEISKPYRIAQNFESSNYFKEDLSSYREFIYEETLRFLSEHDDKDIEKFFGLKDRNMENAKQVMYDYLDLPTMRAVERFNGVMFTAISYYTMDLAQKENFEISVLFIDGLFGVIKPNDLIPEYKLKISSKMYDTKIQDYWKKHLLGVLKRESKKKVVIDILPEEHRKVLSPEFFDEYYIIQFCDRKNGEIKQAGHNSKQLKGELVRFICSKENISRKTLEEFGHSLGYYYNQELSDKQKIVYLKE